MFSEWHSYLFLGFCPIPAESSKLVVQLGLATCYKVKQHNEEYKE